MEIRKVGVIGLGTMGAGIAQVVAQAGFEAYIHDISKEVVDKAIESIERSMVKLQEKGKVSSEEKLRVMERLIRCREIEELKNCDLIIEAIVEDMGMKKDLFMDLDKVCSKPPIFASNTSTLSITEMAACVGHSESFLGLHFFNPPQIMKLVEVVKTPVTDKKVLDTANDFVCSLGKRPVVVKDKGGFLVNRLLTPLLFDAMRALDEGIASTEDIDDGMMLACGHPVGPLKLADIIGLDVLAKGQLYNEFKDKRYSPPNILRRLVALGFHGKKSGRGFYDWSDPKNPVPVEYA